MEKIKLQGLAELKAHEDLPEIPELVQRYLDTEKKQSEGRYFRIVIKEENRDSGTDGIAYLNELRIEKRDGESWSRVYSTGMMQYRGAYADEIDNWDLSFYDPAIFEESESEVVYALRTGIGNVKVFRFSNERLETLVTFNVRDHGATQERIELLQNVVNDSGAFYSYVSKGLGHHWYITDSEALAEDVRVLLLDHADRDYDAISDCYQIWVWVKGKGIGYTGVYNTDLHHPFMDKFYRIGIGFDAAITNRGRNFLDLVAEVYNGKQEWEESRNFRIEWKGTDPSEFEREVEKAMEQVVQSHQHDHPLYKSTQITESVVDAEKGIAAWILFEQIDTDRCTEAGEGWLGDQFRYSLWVMKEGEEPRQIYEDHAYIRPQTKSGLTGTRGRDCTLRNLRLEGDTIKVLHPKGEKVEKQEWKEISFGL